MTQRPEDREPEPSGGRAAKRLQEFIEQRFPGGVPSTENASGQPEPVQQSQLDRLEQQFGELAEAQRRLEARLDQLEQSIQQLIETKKRLKTPKK